jgi:hypothetical protein
MLEATARNLLFFDTILKPHHENVDQPIPLDGILRSVEDANALSEYVKLVENEQAAIRLKDINVDLDQDKAILLVTYADKRGADPVFANLEKGTLRSEPKLDGEGVAISAHIAFSLKKSENGLYAAVLEDVPGIGRTLLDPFLRSAFKTSSTYQFKNPNGNMQKTWPVPTLVLKQSEKLVKSLESGGYITEVEVTKFSAVGGFDKIESISEKQTTTVMKIDGRPTGERALEILNSVKSLAKQKGYLDMRVRWINTGKERKQVKLGTARADAGDVLYGRIERVQLSNALPQCSSQINRELKKKIYSLL